MTFVKVYCVMLNDSLESVHETENGAHTGCAIAIRRFNDACSAEWRFDKIRKFGAEHGLFVRVYPREVLP